jgi:sugar-specific transcriptional regulator TrmB
MASAEIIKSLEGIGFTTYEAKVMHALVEGHILSGAEVAKQARIPRSSAYTILKKFAEKGICNEIQTTTVTQYELIDPKVVKDKIEKDIRDKFQSNISNLTESFDKLQTVFRAKELEGKKIDVELIKGFNRHRRQKFIDLLESSRTEMLVMVRVEAMYAPELDEAAIGFTKRGGKIKTLFEASYNFKLKIGDEWKDASPAALVEMCEKYKIPGEEIRLAEKVSQNIAIFDRKTAFISLIDPTIPKYNRSDVIIRNGNFAAFAADTFDLQWNKADSVEEFKRKLNVK